MRWRYRCALAGRRRLRRKSSAPFENTARHPPRRCIRQDDRGREKDYRAAPGNLGQKIAGAAGAENRRARTAEYCADVGALALLQEDNNHHREANNYVNRFYCYNHQLPCPALTEHGARTLPWPAYLRPARTMRANDSAFKLAPPTRAPSISGSAISESTLSAVT